MFFDSHAHLDDERFDEDREYLIGQLKEKDVSYVLNAGADFESSQNSIALSQKYDFIYASVGIHPHDAVTLSEEGLEGLRDMAGAAKVVAIGEIGLDYYYDHSPRDVQQYWFRRQLQLAKALKLPVIIHERDACEDCLQIIRSENISEIGGVFHCFSGSWETAKELLKMGLYISIGGPVTFKKAVKPVEVVKNIPMDRLLIETDSPYLTPEPHRGKRNDSSHVRYVAQKIGEIRGLSTEEVAARTLENTKRLFKII